MITATAAGPFLHVARGCTVGARARWFINCGAASDTIWKAIPPGSRPRRFGSGKPPAHPIEGVHGNTSSGARLVAKALIIGAGAVGRGLVAPLLDGAGISLDFVDNSEALLKRFSGRSEYLTASAGPERHELTSVRYGQAMHPEEVIEIDGYDVVFVSVGSRNYIRCARLVRDAGPVFVLENVRDAGDRLREASGNAKVRFGIPDAIVSNTASPELLHRDPLCVVAERGLIVLEAGADDPGLSGAVTWAGAAELERYWVAKFFIHNANHAIAAFLGARAGCTFIHEALADARIGGTVERAMEVITEAIIAKGLIDEDFATAYKKRELSRFRNPLMFDPIARVARDPLRKLDRGERLIRGLTLVAEMGLDPAPVALGVSAAMAYRGTGEDDVRFSSYRQSRSPEQVLRELCGLRDERLIGGVLAASPGARRAPRPAHAPR